MSAVGSRQPQQQQGLGLGFGLALGVGATLPSRTARQSGNMPAAQPHAHHHHHQMQQQQAGSGPALGILMNSGSSSDMGSVPRALQVPMLPVYRGAPPPLWDQTLELEKRLRNEMRKRSFWDPEVRRLRASLQTTYEALLFGHYDFAACNDVEANLWKSVFYRPIEEFRSRSKALEALVKAAASATFQTAGTGGAAAALPAGGQAAGALSSPEAARAQLARTTGAYLKFLDEALAFYRKSTWKLQWAYGSVGAQVELDAALQNEIQETMVRYSGPHVPDIRPSVHRCLIHLGDLCRYQSMALKERPSSARPLWERARGYYKQAAIVLPTSGNPYNQLAVMSYYGGEELRAVYYYFRSLAVAAPFPTARENLLLLFEKNRNRYDGIAGVHAALALTSASGGGLPAAAAAAAAGLDAATARQVAAHFSDVSTRFVRLHGLLFDRINLDTFPDVLDAAMRDLERLTAHPACRQALHKAPESDNVLLHLAAMAAFAVHSAAPPPPSAGAPPQQHAQVLGAPGAGGYAAAAQRSILRTHALCAAFRLGALLCGTCHSAPAQEPSPEPYALHSQPAGFGAVSSACHLLLAWLAGNQHLLKQAISTGAAGTGPGAPGAALTATHSLESSEQELVLRASFWSAAGRLTAWLSALARRQRLLPQGWWDGPVTGHGFRQEALGQGQAAQSSAPPQPTGHMRQHSAGSPAALSVLLSDMHLPEEVELIGYLPLAGVETWDAAASLIGNAAVTSAAGAPVGADTAFEVAAVRVVRMLRLLRLLGAAAKPLAAALGSGAGAAAVTDRHNRALRSFQQALEQASQAADSSPPSGSGTPAAGVSILADALNDVPMLQPPPTHRLGPGASANGILEHYSAAPGPRLAVFPPGTASLPQRARSHQQAQQPQMAVTRAASAGDVDMEDVGIRRQQHRPPPSPAPIHDDDDEEEILYQPPKHSSISGLPRQASYNSLAGQAGGLYRSNSGGSLALQASQDNRGGNLSKQPSGGGIGMHSREVSRDGSTSALMRSPSAVSAGGMGTGGLPSPSLPQSPMNTAEGLAFHALPADPTAGLSGGWSVHGPGTGGGPGPSGHAHSVSAHTLAHGAVRPASPSAADLPSASGLLQQIMHSQGHSGTSGGGAAPGSGPARPPTGLPPPGVRSRQPSFSSSTPHPWAQQQQGSGPGVVSGAAVSTPAAAQVLQPVTNHQPVPNALAGLPASLAVQHGQASAFAPQAGALLTASRTHGPSSATGQHMQGAGLQPLLQGGHDFARRATSSSGGVQPLAAASGVPGPLPPQPQHLLSALSPGHQQALGGLPGALSGLPAALQKQQQHPLLGAIGPSHQPATPQPSAVLGWLGIGAGPPASNAPAGAAATLRLQAAAAASANYRAEALASETMEATAVAMADNVLDTLDEEEDGRPPGSSSATERQLEQSLQQQQDEALAAWLQGNGGQAQAQMDALLAGRGMYGFTAGGSSEMEDTLDIVGGAAATAVAAAANVLDGGFGSWGVVEHMQLPGHVQRMQQRLQQQAQANSMAVAAAAGAALPQQVPGVPRGNSTHTSDGGDHSFLSFLAASTTSSSAAGQPGSSAAASSSRPAGKPQ